MVLHQGRLQPATRRRKLGLLQDKRLPTRRREARLQIGGYHDVPAMAASIPVAVAVAVAVAVTVDAAAAVVFRNLVAKSRAERVRDVNRYHTIYSCSPNVRTLHNGGMWRRTKNHWRHRLRLRAVPFHGTPRPPPATARKPRLSLRRKPDQQASIASRSSSEPSFKKLGFRKQVPLSPHELLGTPVFLSSIYSVY